MPLHLTNNQLQQILTHAEQTYPEECCGLLLGTWDRSQPASPKILLEVRPVQNAWSEAAAGWMASVGQDHPQIDAGKRDRYWIDPQEMLTAQRYARDHQLDIIGVYHSHPDHAAIPSECDRLLAWSAYLYVIVSVQQGTAQDWRCWGLDEEQQFRSTEVIVL
ncbi:MAG TPA: M67 family metallopeptidase [Allocoleopsis sp.]